MLIHPNPDPVAIQLGVVSIHWYGLMYLAAFMQFVALGRVRLRQPHIAAIGWKKEDIDDMLFYGVLGVVIGGRLGEVVFYQLPYFLHHPLEIFAVWKGGMSFHGGLIGVMLSMFLWSRKAKRALPDVYDFIAPLVPLGYAFGRIGNFINHELPGRIASADLPWAMMWPGLDQPVHPSPIYQALVDGIFLFIVLWLYARKSRPQLAVGAMFVMLYGCARFFTEFFRTPDFEISLAGFSISGGQLYSLPMIIGGAILIFLAYNKTPSTAPSMQELPAKKNKKRK